MRIDFYISRGDDKRFANSVEAVIRNVDRATKAGTTQACQEILEESLRQVPRDTGTLASTAFYTVSRRMATKNYTYEGVIGYAGIVGAGASKDKFNPKSFKMASEYAVKVHEDLNMRHPNGGKAKFLEDPVRDYGARRFKSVAETHWKYAIETSSSGGESFIPTSE